MVSEGKPRYPLPPGRVGRLEEGGRERGRGRREGGTWVREREGRGLDSGMTEGEGKKILGYRSVHFVTYLFEV